jgi:hypothetical protein
MFTGMAETDMVTLICWLERLGSRGILEVLEWKIREEAMKNRV